MSLENEVKLYRHLLGKYADIINEREKRTIGEIKELVSGNDLSIQSFISDFKDTAYSFEADYKKTLEKVFEFISTKIAFIDIDLNINYWLSAKELLELKVADSEDLAVFLCATMRGLEDEKAEVIIAELDDLKTHAFIITELENKFLLLDPAQKHKFEEYFGNKAEILAKYSFKKQKIRRFLYRFNAQKYEQFLLD